LTKLLYLGSDYRLSNSFLKDWFDDQSISL